MISYRPMVDGDIPAGLCLCRAAGWNQVADDWRLFLELSPKGCCVAVDRNGTVRGTVATVRYEDHLSWIGMVLVDPVVRRKGIGMQLLREAVKILGDDIAVKLDATPDGRNVYLRLGFEDEYHLSRMCVENVNGDLRPVSTVYRMEDRDIPAVVEFDRLVFGADRREVLLSSYRRGREYAFISRENNQLKGYCFGRPGHLFAHIGPVISDDDVTARDLLGAALRNCKGAAILDVTRHSLAWTQHLSLLGFREQRPLIRMFRGNNRYPGLPEKQFAILGPEFG